MRILLLIVIIGSSSSSFAQKILFSEKTAENTTYVKGSKFEGVIFDQKYPHRSKDIPPVNRRFTPSFEELELVEQLLNQQLKENNTDINHGPKIHKNLQKYVRQYVGVISDKGERNIFILCDWWRKDADRPGNWKTEFTKVFDGGSYHWYVLINLEKKKFVHLGTNGIS